MTLVCTTQITKPRSLTDGTCISMRLQPQPHRYVPLLPTSTPAHLSSADYPIAIFATHRLGAVPSPANPSYNPAELQHQLQLSKSCLMFVHSTCLGNAIEAAKLVGMETGRIVLLDGAGGENKGIRTLESLIQEGLAHEPSFIERKLQPGESKTKLSYLCFSSGTTGKPKVRIRFTSWILTMGS